MPTSLTTAVAEADDGAEEVAGVLEEEDPTGVRADDDAAAAAEADDGAGAPGDVAGVLEEEELTGEAAAAAVAEAFAASRDLPDGGAVADDAEAAAAAAVAESFAEAHLSGPPELGPPVCPVVPPIPGAAGASQSPNKRKQKHKKRICKFPGCSSTVKAQGHCQRHGAKTKRCKVQGCDSQAQGSHEGYCKRHWREFAAPEDQRKKSKKKREEEETTCEPVGSSVYDHVIPASFAWKVEGSGGLRTPKKERLTLNGAGAMAELGSIGDVEKDVLGVRDEAQSAELIPILQHLVDNESLDPGWHRSNERLARGIRPPKSLSVQLESWEKQLAILEMALIAGSDTKHLTQHKISKILAHGWGREKGFHKLMIEKHCQRRGDLDRKKRVDAGVPMSVERKAVYRAKRRRLAEVAQGLVVQQDAAEGYGVPVPAPVAATMEELPPPPADETMVGEVVNVDDHIDESAAQYAEAPPPPMEETAMEPMGEPSIEEMVTESV